MDKVKAKEIFMAISRKWPALAVFIFSCYKGSFLNRIKKRTIGKQNIISVKGAVLSSVEFDVIGNNNCILIDPFSCLENVKFLLRGNNHKIHISNGCRFSRGGFICMDDNSGTLNIGSYSTFEEVHIAVTEENSKINIGSDCMFAYDIDIRTGDSHGIWDSTGKRTNKAKDITIGDHVWVAAHSTILKGVEIRANSIVATGAIVTKGSDLEGVVLGGNPACIVKQGITWSRNRNIPPDNESKSMRI